MSATGRVPSEEEAILKSIEDLLEKRDPRRKIARVKSRAEKKIAAEALSDTAPELLQESEADRSNAPMTASATKWEVNEQTLSAPKWGVNDQMTSAPKEICVLKPRGCKGIPAAIVHQVWQRDDYCCVKEFADGSRCASKIGLQVDHICPVSFGQDNWLENLRPLCRQCNIAAAEELLGGAVMERYRWLKSRVYGETWQRIQLATQSQATLLILTSSRIVDQAF